MALIGGLDHAILLVRDLDRGESLAGRLGFQCSPRGIHSPAMGTANTTLMLADGTYLEMMTVRQETPLNARLVEQLRHREGLSGLAFKSDDARRAAAAFGAAGIADGEAASFSRPVELEEGPREAAFTIAKIHGAATPTAFAFVCQHHTPELVWRDELLQHPNGALGLVEIVGVAGDLEGLAAAWTRALGEAGVRMTDDQVMLGTAPPSITFLSPMAFAQRFGTTSVEHPPALAGACVRVADPERVVHLLREGDVPFGQPGPGRVLVWQVCGASIEFVASS